LRKRCSISLINDTSDPITGSSSPTAFASHRPDTAIQRLADYIETTGLVPLPVMGGHCQDFGNFANRALLRPGCSDGFR
jgi:hypothetical protein